MANVKNAILRKKIGEVLYELRVKTSSAMVYVDDTTTLAAKLTEMLADIADSKTKLTSLLGSDAASSITGQIEAAVQDAVDALTDEDDSESLAGKIKAINESIDSINDTTSGILATSKAYTDEKIGLTGTAFATVKAYVDDAVTTVQNNLSGAFHFKGVVDYADELPTEGMAIGDVWQVNYRGTKTEGGTDEVNSEYAYNGEDFVELGSIVDLSEYSTTEQVTTAIGLAKTGAEETAAADATSKANAAQAAAIAAAAADATEKADAAQAAAEATAAADATEKADAAQAAAEATAAADATTKANAAQAAAEETAATALSGAVSTINTTMATKARFLVSETEPEDLTESDIWAQIIPDETPEESGS